FSSRARAQEGWTKLRRQSAALNGFRQRILEGQADRGPVFRLQAVAPTLSEANALCRALRADGLDCQVKS
ncbi:MAG: SPOR domain-containing protein, partial [Pseudomonadota bacterium]